jgi:membrane protein
LPHRHLLRAPVWPLLRDAANAWVDDRASSMGAALAYYTLFSVAPLLLIVIAVAGLVFGETAARGEIIAELSGLLGHDGAAAVQALLESANRPTAGLLATAFGLGALLIGATTVFGELQRALDLIWRAPPRPPADSVWDWLFVRLLSLGMILAIGFLLIVSLLASAGLAAVQRWWTPALSHSGLIGVGLAQAIEFSVSFATITGAFALIYKLMPRVPVAWSDVGVGSVVTALLFTSGKSLIGAYIGASGVASPFGAAGSLVALLIWVYWSAQIFLFGAEFTHVYAMHRLGQLPQAVPPALASASSGAAATPAAARPVP